MADAAPVSVRSVVMLTADRGIDRRITLQADALEADGWMVTIVGAPLDAGETDHDPRVQRIAFARQSAGKEGIVLDAYRWLRARLTMNGPLMRMLKRFTWRWLVDHEGFYVRLFLETALSHRPDVFTAHDLPMLPVGARAAAACGARLVYDSHELFSEQEFSARERESWARIEARYIGQADEVITINPSIARELERRYGLDHVHVILNADRRQQVPARSRYFHDHFGLAPDTRVLLFQGGLSAGRNLTTMVEAFAYVADPSLVLVVLGDGALSVRLRRLAARAGHGRVLFHAAVPQARLLELTVAADAGIIPYQAICLNNRLCTPNKLFEFIVAGLPIVATDLPEIARIIGEQDMGLVGETGSARTMAALIDAFFADHERFARWRTHAARAGGELCWEREQVKLTSIYAGLN
ncbi:MAG: glycosyltransferase [Burkholderiaceae bacterium]